MLFGLGYRFYASFIAHKIYSIQEIKDQVPAVEFEDGIDFVPTKKEILFGHHFTSIAGAAPIIGPCIAAYWGWLPALIWIVFGTIFMGAVHDFGALVISVREKGKTIADITGTIINIISIKSMKKPATKTISRTRTVNISGERFDA